jgi:hypothetical protein
VVARRGSGAAGCLIPLLVVALVVYLGRDFAKVYFRYYQYSDAMRQEKQVGERSDDSIVVHLRLLADSLDLPGNAGQVRIAHTPAGLSIWSDYDEHVELPFNKEKVIHFHPNSETRF